MYEKYTSGSEPSCEIWLSNQKNCQGKSIAREALATAAALTVTFKLHVRSLNVSHTNSNSSYF